MSDIRPIQEGRVEVNTKGNFFYLVLFQFTLVFFDKEYSKSSKKIIYQIFIGDIQIGDHDPEELTLDYKTKNEHFVIISPEKTLWSTNITEQSHEIWNHSHGRLIEFNSNKTNKFFVFYKNDIYICDYQNPAYSVIAININTSTTVEDNRNKNSMKLSTKQTSINIAFPSTTILDNWVNMILFKINKSKFEERHGLMIGKLNLRNRNDCISVLLKNRIFILQDNKLVDVIIVDHKSIISPITIKKLMIIIITSTETYHIAMQSKSDMNDWLMNLNAFAKVPDADIYVNRNNDLMINYLIIVLIVLMIVMMLRFELKLNYVGEYIEMGFKFQHDFGLNRASSLSKVTSKVEFCNSHLTKFSFILDGYVGELTASHFNCTSFNSPDDNSIYMYSFDHRGNKWYSIYGIDSAVSNSCPENGYVLDLTDTAPLRQGDVQSTLGIVRTPSDEYQSVYYTGHISFNNHIHDVYGICHLPFKGCAVGTKSVYTYVATGNQVSGLSGSAVINGYGISGMTSGTEHMETYDYFYLDNCLQTNIILVTRHVCTHLKI
uniref:PH domain-containing protein n=1 Tax=Chromulina nebulosa TaxID=96789 RepID=A0A7S0XCG6_9STRA|mmetsp:Transcript_2247/g.2008  ORF Transcript_2247/g.2008 Transcript_2247/m.2008 type:complete len:547 (+) Transcript_2247:133-1773(+)